MEAELVLFEEAGDSGDRPLRPDSDAQHTDATPPRQEADGDGFPKIPPQGSGARLDFLLGVQTLASIGKGKTAQGGGHHGGHLPPAGKSGGGQRRERAPAATPSDGGGRVQKKRKHVGRKQALAAAPPPPARAPSCSSQAPSESVNEISDGEDDEDDVLEVNVAAPHSRKLTFDVWLEMKRERVRGEWKAFCNYCKKEFTSGPKSGTSHLRDHLKICTQRSLKTKGKAGKLFGQSSLRMTAQVDGKVNVESYTFDQETAREELGNMIVLHDYPLSIVDHVGFRRFVHALQPLFNLHTRNTIRKDIIKRHDKEKKKAQEYMTMLQ